MSISNYPHNETDSTGEEYHVFMSPALDTQLDRLYKLVETLQKDHSEYQQATQKQLDGVTRQLDSMSKIMDMLTKSHTKLTEEYQKISDDNHKIIEENKTFLKALENIQTTENYELKPLLEKLTVNNDKLMENIQSPVFQTRVFNRIWRSTNQLSVMNPMALAGLTNVLFSMNNDKDNTLSLHRNNTANAVNKSGQM